MYMNKKQQNTNAHIHTVYTYACKYVRITYLRMSMVTHAAPKTREKLQTKTCSTMITPTTSHSLQHCYTLPHSHYLTQTFHMAVPGQKVRLLQDSQDFIDQSWTQFENVMQVYTNKSDNTRKDDNHENKNTYG